MHSEAACHDAVNLAEQVMARCDKLAACSAEVDRITRLFLTAPMQEVHSLVHGWMQEAKLQTRVDNAGNIVGRRQAERATQTLVVGSHLDTVPGAGRYDGILGVLIGIAVAETLRDQTLPFHLDVIGFSEEEGIRYNMPYLGSCAVAGSFESDWLQRKDEEEISLRDAISAFGLDPDGIEQASYAADEVLGYVEPHLEQGPMLEQAGLPVGVVNGIAGQSRLRLRFVGEAGHAGTTPMLGRRDALVMASEFIQEIHELGRQTAGLRATIGRLEVVPNAPNVIPGQVELSLDVRQVEDSVREQAIDRMLTIGAAIASTGGGELEVIEQVHKPAVLVDAGLSQLLNEAVGECGYQSSDLFSGAGHDAVAMAQKFPVAMLFLRHPGGISHHPDERVACSDVATAIEVLTRFVLRLAHRYDTEV